MILIKIIGYLKRQDFATKITIAYIVLGGSFMLIFINVIGFLFREEGYQLNNMILIHFFWLIATGLIWYFILRFEAKKNEIANKKLYDFEKRYTLLFNISSIVKLLIDIKDFTVLDANDAAYKFMGVVKEEKISYKFADYFSNSADFELVRNFIESRPKSGSLVIKYNFSPFEIKYLELFPDYLDSYGNNLVYLTVHDITEKFKLEKQNEEYKQNLERLVRERTTDLRKTNLMLERENRRILVAEQRIGNQLIFFKTIMETIPLPVFIKDITGKFIECNKAFADYMGLPKEEIIGFSSYKIVPEKAAKDSIEYDYEVIKTGKGINTEVSFVGRDNREHYIQYAKSPFLKTDGSIEGIIGTINDITEYKDLQNEIKRALEKEQEISNLKSRFISMASHEFRTPLTTILASADLLEMFGRNWSQEKYNEHTSKIRRTVKNMVDLLDDVLIISRADTGKVSFNPSNMNLFNFCCEVVDNVRNNKNEKQNIVFEYLDDHKIISADSRLLGHIFNNLLGNAIKYSPEGGEILFRINFNETRREVYFLIKDNGIGISAEHQKTLFEPFQRGENIGKIPGTGLGLSIVKRSIDLHNGIISCQSEIGKGTTFRVVIPYDLDE